MARETVPDQSRIEKLEGCERRIAAREASAKPWLEGLTADDLIDICKAERAEKFSGVFLQKDEDPEA